MIIHTILLVVLVALMWRSLLDGRACARALARLEQKLATPAPPVVADERPVMAPVAAATHPSVDRRPSVRIELRDEHECQVLGDVRVAAQARRPEMTLTDDKGHTGRFRASREEGGMFVYRRVGITP